MAAARLASLAFAVAAALLLAPAAARACSCAPPPPPDVALANSDAVFEGVARDSRRVVLPSGIGMLMVRLEVARRWKGDVAAVHEVITPDNDGACGYRFTDGTSYLVYAHRRTDFDVFFADRRSLSVSLCWRTRLLTEAAEDLAVLGAGMPPLPAPTAPDAGPDDPDAAPTPDAPTLPDAASPDTAAAPDAAPTPDAPTLPDAASPDTAAAPDAARPAPRSRQSSCAYAATGAPSAASLALLVLLLAVRPRRRR